MQKNLLEIFGKNLRNYRKAHGLSQRDLQLFTGINHSCISKMESGKTNVTLDTITIMGQALEIDPYKFFL